MVMPYMNGVQYKKPVQPKFSPDSRRDKSRIERLVFSTTMMMILLILLQYGRRHLPLKNPQPKTAHQLLIILQWNNRLVRHNGVM
ncbi:Hypothetical predicted protein [Olea europaea subsp. europaea]|nr:Hypothetical predicted protein [Olea europaea subsp. europaea]